jgi:heat shock protein HslJ
MNVVACACAVLGFLSMLAVPAAAAANPPDVPAALRAEALRQATYRGLGPPARQVTLAEGRWQGTPQTPGSATVPSVMLAPERITHGDLDGDGVPEAVVLLVVDPGGSGTFLHLAVVKAVDGRARNVATRRVGDRVQVRDLRVDGGRVVLDVVRAGPQDPSCCPGELATLGWQLKGGRLQPGPVTVTGRLGPAAAAGAEWVLRRWAGGEAVAGDAAPTLAVDGERVAGFSGCNRYMASWTPGASPGEVKSGPVATTRRFCEGDAAAVEARFVAQMSAVRSLRFHFGDLLLDTEGGTLVFARPAAGPR